MQKTTTAAGEAVPSIQRRHLLLGLAAASTAAAVAVLPSSSTSAQVAENPELLRLADLMPDALANFRAAKAAKTAAVLKWRPLWPLAPERITFKFSSYSCDQEYGLDGEPIIREREDGARLVSTAAGISHSIKQVEYLLRSKSFDKNKNGKHRGHTRAEWQAHLDELYEDYALARDYETERDRIKALSGIVDLKKRVSETEKALGSIVKRIMEEPEHTMAGVIIKAQAITEGSAECTFLMFLTLHSDRGDWGSQLARSVLTHATQNGKVL